jgi:hypothetical protein
MFKQKQEVLVNLTVDLGMTGQYFVGEQCPTREGGFHVEKENYIE